MEEHGGTLTSPNPSLFEDTERQHEVSQNAASMFQFARDLEAMMRLPD